MKVVVDWSMARNNGDLQHTCVLYAYLTREKEIFYVGKALSTTVAARIDGRDKEGLWTDALGNRRIEAYQVIVGHLYLEQGRRFSAELLADVESLLIHRLNLPRMQADAPLCCTRHAGHRAGTLGVIIRVIHRADGASDFSALGDFSLPTLVRSDGFGQTRVAKN